MTEDDLKRLARDVAQQVAGENAIEEVEVMPGEESDRLIYQFSFLIDQDVPEASGSTPFAIDSKTPR
ncbi:MAG: hypothetical protein JOZ17_06415 [Acetobacteraceae bacterium]|nr:hypothetical protein [Acetobacteraceae bacterium]